MTNKKLKLTPQLSEMGFSIILLKENKKIPIFSGWQENATNDKEEIKQLIEQYPNANIGVITGKKSNIIALDFDVKNNQQGLESFKRLKHLFEERLDTLKNLTPSGGFHLIFKYPSNNQIGNKIGVLGGLDIRGDGGLIAVQPSIINKKCYNWENKDTPILELPDELAAIIKYGKEVLPPCNVSESKRNDEMFNYARKLHKHVREKGLKEKLVLFAASKCKPPLEEKEAIKCLKSAEKYVSENELKEHVKKINKEYAVTMIGTKCVILKELHNPVLDRNEIDFLNPNDFHNFLANKIIWREGKPRAVSRLWMSHDKRRQYKSIMFSPSGDHEGYYNMWKGFAFEPQKGDWSLFKEHINDNICRGTKSLSQYVYAWMADAIQNPDKRPGTALVLRGPQGVGKSLYATFFGDLFGQHFVPVTNSKHLTGSFNSHLKDACMVFADEALWGGQNHVTGVLKSMVTEKNLVIEQKGKDVIILPNHIRLIIASNDSWVVPAGLEERRFVIIDVGTDYMQDHDYFEKVVNQMENGGYEAMLYDLMHHDYSDVNLRKIPQTKGLQEMKIHSMTPIQIFWYNILTNGYLSEEGNSKWPEWISVNEFYQHYCDGLGRSQYDKGGVTQFGMEIRKLMPKFTTSKRRVKNHLSKKQVKGYELPSLKECRRHFDKITQTKNDWDERK